MSDLIALAKQAGGIVDFEDTTFVDFSVPALQAFADLIRKEAWQPIETVPKNGPILIIDADAESPRVAWGCYPCETAYGGTAVGDWYITSMCSMSPTHWMPLPPPPAVRARTTT
jgi:hypothetical protein